MLLTFTFLSAFILYCVNIFDDNVLKPIRRIGFLFIMFLLFLLICFTQSTIDYVGYEKYYKAVKTLTNYNNDIAFNYLILFSKFWGWSYSTFYHFVGFLNIVLLSIIVIICFESDKERCVFMICYLSFSFLLKDLIQIRNALALKVFFLCVYNFFNKNRSFALVLFVVAVLIHNSIIMFFPIFFIYKTIKFSWVHLILFYILFIFAYFYKGFLNIYSNLPVFKGRLGSYLDYSSRKYDPLSKFHFFRLCIYLFFFFIFSKNMYEEKDLFLFWCIAYGYLIRICFVDVSLLSGRLAENTYPLESFLLVDFLKYSHSWKKKLIIYCFIIVYCIIFINMLFTNLDLLNEYQNLIM